MTTTVEQLQSEWPNILEAAQRGEDVMILSQGKIVAKLIAVTTAATSTPPDPVQWHKKLQHLRESLATGKITPSSDEILEQLREERIE